MKYLTNLDLNKNELQNVVAQKVGTLPAAADSIEGQFLYLTSGKKGLYQFNGTAWKLVGTTYTTELGAAASNSVPFKLVGSDGTTETINIKGAGGATLTVSGDTLTITTADTNTKYELTGDATPSNFTIALDPLPSGDGDIVTVPLATTTNAGLLSPAEKSKLAGVATGANNYTHPTGDGNHHVPATGTGNSGKVLKAGATAGSEAWGTLAKGEVGLGNVDNTSDANKPVSTPQANALALKAPLASPALTGTPTAPTPTGNTGIANKVYVDNAVANGIAASDAMIFKGTIGTGGTVTALPTTYKTGWTYRVITAGTYAGNVCEIGDLIVALIDRAGSDNANADWTVAQTNINGAITGITGTTPIIVTGSGSSRAITHAASGVTAGDYGTKGGMMVPQFGAALGDIPYFSVDAKGHLTKAGVFKIQMPDTLAATTNDGLMSRIDKTRLDNLHSRFDGVVRGSVQIPVGQTTASINTQSPATRMESYRAEEWGTGEQVMVDFKPTVMGSVVIFNWSIAKAHDAIITIYYISHKI